MAGAELPLLDQSVPDLSDSEESDGTGNTDADDKFEFTDDPNVVFAEEREGWKGFVSTRAGGLNSRG